ncbi:MAG: DUF3857 domain-containing protein [Bacteroidota bacterium]
MLSSKTLRNTNRRYAFFLATCLFIFPFNDVFAQGKNFSINQNQPSWIVKIAQQEKRPADRDISDGYFLSLWENQTHAKLNEDFTHVIRQIVSDAGVQNGSQISITYDPDFQKLIFHKLILWREGEAPQNRLPGARFKILQNEKELSKFIYSGTYDAFLLLDDVRKGDKIEYSFTIAGNNPIYGKKLASIIYSESSSSIGHTYSNMIVNKNRTLNIKNFNANESPRIRELAGMKIYEWENTLTKTHRTEDFEPSWHNPFKRTQITEYKSWNEVVNWGLHVNDYPNPGKTPLLQKKIAEFRIKAKGDPKKYIQIAKRFVQDEIRYMGIEVGAYSHRPNSPEKVLVQRYGDCKDKSMLLVNLLKGMDIKAYMTYVDTYTTIKTNEYLPSPFVFNHVIVTIEHEGYKLWIDPTISYQRGTYDNFYSPNYGYGLILKEGVNALEEISSIKTGKLISNLVFNVADTLSSKKSTLTVSSKYSDNYADDIRNELSSSGTNDLEKNYQEYYAKYYPGLETKAPIQIKDDEEANIVEITESYEISDIWTEKAENGKALVYLYADLISNELRNINSKKRKSPLALKYPVNIEQNITVNMPYPGDYGTESFKVENDNYYFELYRFQRNNTETFTYVFRNTKPFIPASETKQYVKDYKKITEYLSYTLSAGGTSPSTEANYYTILIFMLIILISAFFFYMIYHKSEDFDLEEIEQARSVGGWLILLAIRLISLPIALLFSPIKSGLFDRVVWDNLSSLTASQEYLIKITFVFQVIYLAILLNFAVLLIVLFFKRRASFPKLKIIFAIALISYLLIDLILGFYIGIQSQVSITNGDVVTVIVSCLINVAWIWYLIKSERVRETFVFTYPESEWTNALIQLYNKRDNEQTNNNEHQNRS